uniref:Uncharacterized protein n=1 Tax=Eucampia antarctica TaxID=49252 RepID=A0A7S2SGU6_9STRA|mmetsp:Transcript_8104/g.7647  ORF Transcript_8104/g.7647 Transcript_8104/m.7647 type:complete len:254 (+) Transcript_8104:65-826(+)
MWVGFLLLSIFRTASSFALLHTQVNNQAHQCHAVNQDKRCRVAMVPSSENNDAESSRRYILGRLLKLTGTIAVTKASVSQAYTPDADPVKESLYFVSRVQEATVQQERFINKTPRQEDLKQKMKLTLRLIEKNYKLLDQITFLASYIQSQDDVVVATSAGYEAVDALQNAIDYVKTDLNTGPIRNDQKEFLTSNLRTCREELFIFLKYIPSDKLAEARKRVEQENVLNREEYDGDGSEGVFNPVVLPWKSQPQ